MDRPLCIVCNKNLAAKRGEGFRKKCARCASTPHRLKREAARNDARRRPWAKFKKNYCEGLECNWAGRLAPFQLDVDHIDGDRKNNDPDNLQTLCANCHRMKTHLNQENKPRAQRGKNVLVDVDTAMIAVLD